MSPFGSLDYFLVLLIAMIAPVVCGLRGKNLRGSTLIVTAVMLVLIFDSPAKLLTLVLFWGWQAAVLFGYLRLRARAPQRWLLWLALVLSLAPLLDNAIYENIVMVPFDDKSITWSIAFIHQDYEKLGAAAKKFIAYIIDHVK